MPFTNLSFETAGSSGPGCADGWTYASHGQHLSAAFDTTAAPWEDFEEEWSSNEDYLFAVAGIDILAAAFTTAAPAPKPYENFEEFWSTNQNYVFALASATGVFDATPQNFEDFGEEWESNEGYLYAFVGPGTDLVIGAFDVVPEDFEDFEEDWSEPYLYAFVGVGSDLFAAPFDAAPEDFEDFEEDFPTWVMTTI